jgi:glycosyltransferase involved in cell wall biosynthesis
LILFSFVIPAHQEEDRICLTIRSILENKFKSKIEILVINDGSTDRTGHRARDAGATVYSINARNRSVARNYGASVATGKWLVFLDADVVLDKNWSEEIDKKIQSPLKIVYQGPIIPAGQKNVLLSFRKFYSKEKTDGTYCSFLTPYGLPQLNSACFVIQKNHFQEIGGFDEDLLRCEDSDLGYRLFIEGFVFSVVPSMKSQVFWSHGFIAYLKRFYHHGKASEKLDKKWSINSEKKFINLMKYAFSTPHPFLMSLVQSLFFCGWIKESFELKTKTSLRELKFEMFMKNYLLPDVLNWNTPYKPGPFTRFVSCQDETRVFYQDYQGQVHQWKSSYNISQLDRHLEHDESPGGFIYLPLV